jgi:hypothetical protein
MGSLEDKIRVANSSLEFAHTLINPGRRNQVE